MASWNVFYRGCGRIIKVLYGALLGNLHSRQHGDITQFAFSGCGRYQGVTGRAAC